MNIVETDSVTKESLALALKRSGLGLGLGLEDH